MALDRDDRIHATLKEGSAIDRAVWRAIREAVLSHKRAGLPVASWRDGKVVWIPADQIEIPDDTPGR